LSGFVEFLRSYRYVDGSLRHHARALKDRASFLVRGVLRNRRTSPAPLVSDKRCHQEDFMSNQNAEVVSVRIIPNTEGKPPGSSRTRR